jgi:hypothetical protein
VKDDMSNLRVQLAQIASQFTASVLDAMRGASLAELAGQAGPTGSRNATRARLSTRNARSGATASPVESRIVKGGRKKRSSSDEVQKQKDTALAAAKQLKPGFSKSDVMKKARSPIDLGRALALLVVDGELTKKGERRKTRYWVR